VRGWGGGKRRKKWEVDPQHILGTLSSLSPLREGHKSNRKEESARPKECTSYAAMSQVPQGRL
jgi:hypothetical protein